MTRPGPRPDAGADQRGAARLSADEHDLRSARAAQRRLQETRDRKPTTWWLPWIFVGGLVVSALGLVTSIAWILDGGALRWIDAVFAIFFALFALSVGSWLARPLRSRPRIVPYFAREIEPYGGTTSAAFVRGSGLYNGLAALDELARAAGVTPLSAFGFADDYYAQQVRWHPAAEGVRTTEALRQASATQHSLAPEVVGDLEALAAVLRVAAERGVDFSLVLRLEKRDSVQVVSSLQPRQGRFW